MNNEVKPGFAPRYMLVWDSYETKAVKRIVLGVSHAGECTVVGDSYEEAYKRGRQFKTRVYTYCKELQAKRPMTNPEMRGFLANTPGVETRHKDSNTWMANRRIADDVIPQYHVWRRISPTGETGPEQEFEV